MAPPGSTSSKKTSSSNSNPFGMAASQGSIPTPGISAASPATRKEITRQQFFKGRPDVSDDRLVRRQTQADELRAFKQGLTIAPGTTNLYQEQAPTFNPMTGRYERTTLADKAQELALKYGPTFREIGSDIGYATGSMAKGFGDLLSSGSFGILGAIKGIANYALDKANKGYDKLNDVQKYVFDNADRFTFASKVPQVEEVSKAEELALQADRDALGLELDQLIRERETNPTVDLRSAKDYIDYQVSRPSYATTQPIDVKEKFQSAAEGYLDPKAREEALKKLEELNRMQTVEELQPKEKSELGFFDLLNPFDEVPIQVGINEMINPEQIDIEKFKEENQQGFNVVPEAGAAEMGTQVTKYNNPGNLKFANQASAIQGQTYGPGYAIFPTAEAGLEALRNDLTAKVNRNNRVEDIIGKYAPRSDNLESFDNYIGFVKDRVGDTVEPNEINDLMKSIIRFENKPDIANKYLPMVADGGMIDKQLKSLQNGLQNMYNGIPSVRRR
jgi:hypothetical protein